jgi:hypothetical protein
MITNAVRGFWGNDGIIEGFDLMNGLIQSWIHNPVSYGNYGGWDLVGGNDYWSYSFGGYVLSLPSSSVCLSASWSL